MAMAKIVSEQKHIIVVLKDRSTLKLIYSHVWNKKEDTAEKAKRN